MSDKKKSSDAAAAVLSRFQKFETVRIHRGQLKGADYNPRYISDAAKVKLRKILAKHGLVESLVWNKRTNNVVGGHQRISCLDALEGTDNYLLDVCQIDVDEKTEKELNIALNNQAAMGEFDLGKLESMYRDNNLDFESTGFDAADVYKLFGDSPLHAQPESVAKLAEQYRELRAKHEALAKELGSRDDPNFYVVAVFQSWEHRKQFLDALGLEDNRFVDGRFLTAKLGGNGEGPDIAKAA